MTLLCNAVVYFAIFFPWFKAVIIIESHQSPPKQSRARVWRANISNPPRGPHKHFWRRKDGEFFVTERTLLLTVCRLLLCEGSDLSSTEFWSKGLLLKRLASHIHHLSLMIFFFLQKTKSGLYIPEKAQGKVNKATVVAAGEGAKDKVGIFKEKQFTH